MNKLFRLSMRGVVWILKLIGFVVFTVLLVLLGFVGYRIYEAYTESYEDFPQKQLSCPMPSGSKIAILSAFSATYSKGCWDLSRQNIRPNKAVDQSSETRLDRLLNNAVQSAIEKEWPRTYDMATPRFFSGKKEPLGFPAELAGFGINGSWGRTAECIHLKGMAQYIRRHKLDAVLVLAPLSYYVPVVGGDVVGAGIYYQGKHKKHVKSSNKDSQQKMEDTEEERTPCHSYLYIAYTIYLSTPQHPNKLLSLDKQVYYVKLTTDSIVNRKKCLYPVEDLALFFIR